MQWLGINDFVKGELRNAAMHNLASPPSSPAVGQMYFDTTGGDSKPYIWDGTTWQSMVTVGGATDHGALSGLSDDDHAQYALLAGRVGGQVLIGDTASAGDLFLVSTAHATKGQIYFGPTTSAAAFVDQTTGDITGNVIVSTVSIGTAPLTVTSTTVVANLNADKVDGQDGAYYLARANHTGTQLASTVSDFDTQVRTSRLDQMAAPTGSVSLNSQKIVSLATPTADGDAATKAYVDGLANGVDWKASVRAKTTVDLDLTVDLANGTTHDGVTVATGDRILVAEQTTANQNGIYIVPASGAASRSTDADVSAEVTSGLAVWVNEGTVFADTAWVLTTNDPITLGTTGLTFTQFSGLGQVTAGAGLTKTGSTLDVVAGTGIVVNANDVALTGQALALHNLGTSGLIARTGAGTVSGRTLTGTSSRLSVSNGDGVSGNPTADIDAAYVGQASITTLGTITTGVWTGTTIAVANGGTAQTTAAGARGTSGIGAGTAAANGTNTTATSRGIARVVEGVLTGTGAATAFAFTHNLGTKTVLTQVRDASDNVVLVDVTNTDTNTVTVTFAVAPANALVFNVVIIGY